MPRKPRQKSESGIYHIMLRGINQQAIFEDEEDRRQGDGSVVFDTRGRFSCVVKSEIKGVKGKPLASFLLTASAG